jgi:cysteine-rich repeat protein
MELWSWINRSLGPVVLVVCLGSPMLAWGTCGDEVLDPGEDCDDRNWFGGDGCAQNCTHETVRDFVLDPQRSLATTQLESLIFRLNLNGSLKFTTGAPDQNRVIPFVIRAEDVHFDPIQVPPIGCVCVRSQADPEIFGPGNAASGSIGCGDADFFVKDYLLTQDHNVGVVGTCIRGEDAGSPCGEDQDCSLDDCFTESDCWMIGGWVEPPDATHPGVCNGPPEFTPVSGGPRGSAAIVDNVSFTFFFDGGTCCVAGIDTECEDPDGLKGPDGAPCTGDDLVIDPGANLPAVTGRARTGVFDANNQPGRVLDGSVMCDAEPCVAQASGELFDCSSILADPNAGLGSGVFALAFPILDNADFGDSLATIRFASVSPHACEGDCSGDGKVTIDELVTAVAVALGTKSVTECTRADGDSSGNVEINELVRAVNGALLGCK